MARIVVAGGVNQDEVVHLEGPLQPGRTGAGGAAVARLGGGGANAAIALALAGHAVTLAGVVGQDAAGDAILSALARRGVGTGRIRRVPGPTTRMLVLIEPDGERTVLRLGPYRARELCAEDLPASADGAFLKVAGPALAPAAARLLSHGPVVAQLPGAEGAVLPELSSPAHVLVGGVAELPPMAAGDPFAWGRRLAGPSLLAVVLTDGPRGVVAHTATGVLRRPVVPARQVDATGAGDAFAAGLLHGLVAGLPLDRALATGCAWGAVAVGHEGSALPPEAAAALRAAVPLPDFRHGDGG